MHALGRYQFGDAVGQLDLAARAAPDALVSLGDLVGYNADPEACVEAVLDRAAGSDIEVSQRLAALLQSLMDNAPKA